MTVAPSHDPSCKPVRVVDCACATVFGDATETHAALAAGRRGLQWVPVLGEDGGDAVPLALRSPLQVGIPPRWWDDLLRFTAPLANGNWGQAGRPVLICSSNYGIDGLYGLASRKEAQYAPWATPHALADRLAERLGWGGNRVLLSHACVSAQVGLQQAARWLHYGGAEAALVLSFDFVGPFVAGGFHALKILNDRMPAPYALGDSGSIGLGDGMAWAVLQREGDGPRLSRQVLYNEMHHFTGNLADGSGFERGLAGLGEDLRPDRVWVKGHGTGTLAAGRLEAEAVARRFPGAPLVSWKGALGHTLGSCALVEMVLAIAACRRGLIPGTVGTEGPCFTSEVMTTPFAADAFDGAVLLSNAFGGAHAAMYLTHD